MNYDISIEQPVLGCIINYYDEFSSYLGKLEKSDFVYRSELFEVIKQEYDNGNKTDRSILLSRCFEKGLTDEVTECCEAVTTSQNFKSYFDELKSMSSRRRLKNAVMAIAYSTEDVKISDLQKIIDNESERFINGFRTKAEENLTEYIKNIGVKRQRIYTGFPTLDNTLGGLRMPSVCYIGARPSTGKTTFAINIAAEQIHRKVLFFSLEMSAEMIYERMAAAALRIDYNRFSRQSLSDEQCERIREYARTLKSEGSFYVLDDVYSIEGISSAALEVQPELIVIDYVQKLTTTKNMFNLREQMEYISGEIKRIAKFNNCCIIGLSQIARQGKDAPTMSDLKESGALEADGDYIMLLHRPYVVDKSNPEHAPSDTQILVDKNKYGSTGVIKMYFNGKHQQFREVSKYDSGGA